MSDQPLIAVRIKDGIFVGNVTAAHDEDFLVMNKCTHVINCAGAEVRDLYQNSGIQYLTFMWKDTNSSTCTTVMFDSADRNVESAMRFIDKALEAGECVLIHSFFGVSRSCALCGAYLMLKYGWNADNALQFIAMAHQEINIKPYFLRQLRTFAKRHEVDYDVFDTRIDDSHFTLDNEQWSLRNTFVNGLVADVQETHELYRAASNQIKVLDANFKNAARRRRRITFTDTKQGTSVHSDQTQPLVMPERAQHHVDPATGAAFVASRTAPGGAPPQPALARRGTPNRHRIEGEHAKGRQVLVLRGEFQQQQPPMTTTAAPAAQQPPAQQQWSVAPATTQPAAPPPPARPLFGAPGGPREDYYARNAEPSLAPSSAPNSGFTLRSYETAGDRGGNGGGPIEAELPARRNYGDGDESSFRTHQQQQHSAAMVAMAPPSASAAQQQQQRAATAPAAVRTKIASPFTLTAGGARRGSPLPKRQVGAGGSLGAPAPTSTIANASGGGITRGRTLTHPAVSAVYGNPGSRTNSPQPQLSQGGSSASGLLRRPVMRASSPQQQQQQQPAPRASSPFGGPSTSAAQAPRVAPSSLSSYGVAPGTGLVGSGSGVRGTPTSHYVFQQQPTSTVPNANSTVQRYPPQQPTITNTYPYGGGGTSTSGVRGAPLSAVPTSLTASSAVRTNSPLARRASSPMSAPGPQYTTSSQQPPIRPGSPITRPTAVSSLSAASRSSPQRLAEQYLSGAASASAYGRDTNASILRRNSSAQRR